MQLADKQSTRDRDSRVARQSCGSCRSSPSIISLPQQRTASDPSPAPSGESGRQSPSHRCNRVRDVAFRPQRRILWAGNLRVGQIAGTTWRPDLLRGESSPARRSGTRRPQCKGWRDGGSRAIPGLQQPDLLLEFLIIALDPPAQLSNVNERRNAASSGSVDNQYLIGSFSPLGHSISSHSSGRLSASQ
jgi:hypothetical protein